MRTLVIVLGLLISSLWAQQPPLKTIAEIQTPVDLATGNDTSVLHGQRVRVRGVVVTEPSWHRHYNTSPTPGSSRCSIWLQDSARSGPKSGLQVRRQNTTNKPVGFTSLVQGQYVELTGTVGYFQGEIQLNVDTTVSPIVLSPNVPLAPPTPISVLDLNLPNGSHNLQVGDQWQGSYVKLTNLQVTGASGSPPWRITCVDANGNQILIFGEFKGLSNAYPNNTRLDSVKGIVLHYWPSSGTPMYEICPWDDSLMYVGNPVPVVTNLRRTPVCPKPSETVTIQVDASTATSADPVTQVTLYWATGASTTYSTVPMTRIGTTNTYEATLPAQPEGTYVHYYVVAQDQSGDQVPFPRFEPQSYRVNSAGCRITDIQYVVPSVLYAYNPSGRRDYLSSGYNRLPVTDVPGVVTATENDLGYIYIQQPGALDWAGIWVRPTGTAPALQIGDSVVITNAEVDEYFGLTNLRNATITRVGPASAPIAPVVLPLNIVYGDTQTAATEPYESMLVRFRHDSPAQFLRVVQPKVSTQSQHAGDYRVGMDAAEPLRGIRVLAGRQTSNVFSSLKVSYINDSSWAVTDGLIDPTLPLCVVGDTTELDSVQGILTYQWNFIKLLPRRNSDFFGVRRTSCGSASGGGGDPSAIVSTGLEGVWVGPNPTTGELWVVVPEEYGVLQAALFTLEGKEIERRTVAGRSPWDLSRVPVGVYLLTLEGSQGRAVVRIARW